MYLCRSLIRKRREINRQKGLKGARVREANRIAAHGHEPPMPETLTDDIEITIQRRINGTALPPQRYLLVHEEGRGRIDQYDTWDITTGRYIDLMGIDELFNHAARSCPRMRRTA